MKFFWLHITGKNMIRLLLLVFLIVCPFVCYSQTPTTSIDSLLKQLYRVAPVYKDTIQEYKANMYVRALLNIDKKNLLFRYLPQVLRSEKGITQYMLETYRDIHYTYPSIYDQKIRYINGTLRDHKNIPGVINYFNINIYEPYLVGDALLSPQLPPGLYHDGHSEPFPISRVFYPQKQKLSTGKGTDGHQRQFMERAPHCL